MIHATLIANLGLTVTGQSTLTTATTGNSPVRIDTYDIALTLRAPHRRPTPSRNSVSRRPTSPTTASKFCSAGGVLGQCLLVYDGQLGLFTLTYCRPGLKEDAGAVIHELWTRNSRRRSWM